MSLVDMLEIYSSGDNAHVHPRYGGEIEADEPGRYAGDVYCIAG